MIRTRKPAKNSVPCSTAGCPTNTTDITGKCSKCKNQMSKRNICAICEGFPRGNSERLFYCRNHQDLHKTADNKLRFQTGAALKICQGTITQFAAGDEHRIKKVDLHTIKCEYVDLIEELKEERDKVYQELFVAITVFDRKLTALIERVMIKGVREGKLEAKDLLDFCTTDDESGSATDNGYGTDQGYTDAGSDPEDDQSTTSEAPIPDDL